LACGLSIPVTSPGSFTPALLTFIVYVVFTGSIKPFDLATGLVVALVIGFLVGRYFVKDSRKALNPVRWLWVLIYLVKYLTVIEIKVHIDVIKRIITGRYNPGIVRVPTKMKTAYGKMLVANSITNTPGTVVVDLDEDALYVNWIDVKTEDGAQARKLISEEFEKFAEKIFE